MRKIPFAKVESLQNDFVMVAERGGGRWTGHAAKAMCDRRCGVGADGLILLGPSTRNGVRFRLFNCDGSRAEWSGNGVRCAAAFLAMCQPRRREFHLLTGAGCIQVSIDRAKSSGTLVSFERPFPTVGSVGGTRAIGAGGIVRPLTVDAGNPHWVFMVRTFNFPWENIGAACQERSRATDGVNVEFVRVKSRRRIELRLFERGVGPTPSSGSGALAAFAACLSRDMVGDRVLVESPGGGQEVECDTERRRIRLTAPARVVSTGVWFTP